MIVLIFRLIFISLALGFAAACTASPTAPSRSAGAPALLGAQRSSIFYEPAEPPPVPPRISMNPPGALSAVSFLAFGDSITSGSLSSYDGAFLYDVPSHSYPVRLELALNQYHGPQRFVVWNAGLSGEWAQDGARRVQSAIAANRPQVLLVLEGINDLASGVSVSTTANAVARIIDTARQSNITVLVATMPPTYATITPNGEERDNATALIRPFNTEVQRIASTRQNVHVVDLNRAFGTNRSLIGGDGLHPTEAGYQLMATTFLSAIETVFPVRGSFQ